MNSNILIVDDDEDTRTLVRHSLTFDSLQVLEASRLSQARKLIQEEKPIIILLDITLPDGSGIDLCHALRERPDRKEFCVIMLTALSSIGHQVIGLDAGANDYIPKPFDPAVLAARVRSALRSLQLTEPDVAILSKGSIRLCLKTRKAWLEGGSLELAPKEFDLLRALVQASPQPLSQKRLLKELWNIDSASGNHTLRVHVERPRRRLGSQGNRIRAVYGEGYQFLSEDDLEAKFSSLTIR